MSQIDDQNEITNLISEAVFYAKIRRNQVTNAEIHLPSLSYEEMESLAGGGKPPRKSSIGIRKIKNEGV